MTLRERLRERKLFQWGLAYLAGAWLLLQVLDVVGDKFEWPNAVGRIAIVLLGTGFLAALVLAWYHGERGQQRVTTVELLMLAGIFVLAGVGVASVRGGTHEDPDATPDTGDPPSPGAHAPEARSIAVLPFENLSDSQENEYFSDGITEDIIANVSRIGKLRVISRTSAKAYKGSTLRAPEIARELGVAHILEGSVRRSEDRVRVVAQLIDARSDRHLWAGTYDRELKDVFAVQGEIARRIAAALEAGLTADERSRLGTRPTESLEAYELYLRANALDGTYRDKAELRTELLRRALALDPSFAAAHALLGVTFAELREVHGLSRDWADSAVARGHRAIALDSTLSLGHYALNYGFWMQGRLRRALDAVRRAVELDPSSGQTLNGILVGEATLGRLDDAINWGLRGMPIDPKNPFLPNNTGWAYRDLGDLAAAERYLRQSLAIQPGFPWPHMNLAVLEVYRGDFARARTWAEALLAHDPDHVVGLEAAGFVESAAGDWTTARRYYERLYRLAPESRASVVMTSRRVLYAQTLLRTGDPERGLALLDTAQLRASEEIEYGSEYPGLRVDRAAIHAMRGERDEAVRWLEEAYRTGRRTAWLDRDPLLEELRDDPRFIALAGRMRVDCEAMRRRVLDVRGAP